MRPAVENLDPRGGAEVDGRHPDRARTEVDRQDPDGVFHSPVATEASPRLSIISSR